jgi:hypothetical protein
MRDSSLALIASDNLLHVRITDMSSQFGKKLRMLAAYFIVAQVIILSGFSSSTVYAFGAPDFGFTISQTTQIGLTATYTLKFIPFNGFMGTVIENVLGVPTGSFSMGTFFLSTPVTDTLVVGNLSLSTTYQLTITASADALSHSVSTILTTPKASPDNSNSNGMIGSGNGLVPDFEMHITQAAQIPGQMSTTYYITYTSINGLTGPIDEKVTNIPREFVSFFSSQYNPYSAGPYGDPMLGPTPSPSFGRCYIRYVGLSYHTCTDALTIYYTIANGAKSLPGSAYSIIVTAAAEGGFPTHSLPVGSVPVPEFSGIATTAISVMALAISIGVLRRRLH